MNYVNLYVFYKYENLFRMQYDPLFRMQLPIYLTLNYEHKIIF